MESGRFLLAGARSLHAAAVWLLPILLVLAVLIGVGRAQSAAALDLDSREYKLMLDPAKFAGAPQSAAGHLWDQLQTIIAERLGPRENGKPRYKGSFAPKQDRTIVFRDTETCLLNANGYVLRERVRTRGGQFGARELTLKFRAPDIFLGAQSVVGAATEHARIKFEEDIAPLIERTISASGQESRAFARPPTMRSLFSRSITQRIGADRAMQSLADVTGLHPGLKEALTQSGAGDAALNAPLQSGERIQERVFSGAHVDLGEGMDAEFDLTLWQTQAQLVIVELSFKYETEDGEVPPPVARRALTLFQSMQEMLGDWASPERETKTSLALPESCQR